MIIVDTNVVSELMRPTPSATVVAWLRTQRASELCTTSITIAEILYGVDRLPEGRRKALLATAATGVFAEFTDRVLAFDAKAAGHYARIISARERAGLPISGFDAQIAAICRVHGAPLATRNTRDFDETGVAVINPWIVGA